MMARACSAAPFIDVLELRGGEHWLGAYPVARGLGASAAASRVGSRSGVRLIGRSARGLKRVVAPSIGAGFVIGMKEVESVYGTHAPRTSARGAAGRACARADSRVVAGETPSWVSSAPCCG